MRASLWASCRNISNSNGGEAMSIQVIDKSVVVTLLFRKDEYTNTQLHPKLAEKLSNSNIRFDDGVPTTDIDGLKLLNVVNDASLKDLAKYKSFDDYVRSKNPGITDFSVHNYRQRIERQGGLTADEVYTLAKGRYGKPTSQAPKAEAPARQIVNELYSASA